MPWERRGQRTGECVHAKKLLWTEDVPEFSGEFCSFPKAVMLPKPVQIPHPPIIVGGTSIPALKRAGEIGDGGYGIEVSVEKFRKKCSVSKSTRQLLVVILVSSASPLPSTWQRQSNSINSNTPVTLGLGG